MNHTKYDFGLCPQGTNAVVAVISYTGYDMEDAMIMNKGSYERGLGHGLYIKATSRSSMKEQTDQHLLRNLDSECSTLRNLKCNNELELILLNKVSILMVCRQSEKN